MATLVITVIGDDRAGLVDALSGAVAEHGGNWERSHMAELAGKFAGLVLVRVPDNGVEALVSALDSIEAEGLLDITAERAADHDGRTEMRRFDLSLLGQDHPGIVHEVSHVLAQHQASIDELESTTLPAPQGGHLFKAVATIGVPVSKSIEEIHAALESVAADLVVELAVRDDA